MVYREVGIMYPCDQGNPIHVYLGMVGIAVQRFH